MNRLSRLAILATTLILSCSCIKEQLETVYSSQEEKIDSYITNLLKKDASFSVTHHKGSNRVTLLEGSGEALEEGGTVTFIYAVYLFNGGVSARDLIGTNDRKTAEEAGLNLTDNTFAPYTAHLDDKDLIKGLKNGLLGVKAGEECQIIFSGKHGFGNKHNNVIPKNQALLYHMKVTEVAND